MPKRKKLINDGCSAWWDFEKEFLLRVFFTTFTRPVHYILKIKHVQIQIKNTF